MDLHIRNARLVPLGEAIPAREPLSVLVREGRVAALGPELVAQGARDVDAEGRWLIPGLWDEHVHLAQWARTADWLDLSGVQSAAEALARVASEAPRHTGLLQGFGHRSATWNDELSVAALDAVCGDRPVVLVSGDAHHGWLNSAALAMFDLAPRDAAVEEAEWFAVYARMDARSTDAQREHRLLSCAVRQANARGVVGITDMEFGRPFEAWPLRHADGLDSLRVRTATYPDTLEDVIRAGLASGDHLPGDHDGLLIMGPLKIISDGSLNTRTAYCHEPYRDSPGQGLLNVSRADLRDLLRRATVHGLECAVHAIGDAAVASALDCFAETGARGSIEHAQLVMPSDVSRLGTLDVTASVQPAHLLDDRDVARQCWGEPRADRCFPLRSMLRAGVRLAFGSDAPVSPLDPWLAMAAAVHRSADARAPWNPEESLTPAQALAASVHGASTVGVGSVADLVLLDSDPLAPATDTGEAAARLRSMPVAMTVVAGRVVHDAT